MTKQEFLEQLKAIYKVYSKHRISDNVGGDFLEKVKNLAFLYNEELLAPVFDRWVNDERAAEIIRKQPTLSDIMGAVYYIDHLTGVYNYDNKYDILMDTDLYDVLEDIFEVLGIPDPKWYKDEEDEEDEDDDDKEDEE